MQLRFTLRQIEYFVAVGEAGSIIQASERIAVSPPSISAAIAQLEQEFGLQLFVRQHAQGLTLTPGGRRFFNEAKQLLAQAGGLHDVAADIAERVRGPLNVGCLITLAPGLMPQLRKGFEALHPDVRLAQFEDDQASLFDMLNRAMIDLAITYDLEIPQEFSFAPLAALPPYAIFPEDHKLAGRDSVTLDDLVEEPMVLLDLPLSRDYFLSLFHQQGLRPKISRARAADGEHAWSRGQWLRLCARQLPAGAGFGARRETIAPRTTRRQLSTDEDRCRND